MANFPSVIDQIMPVFVRNKNIEVTVEELVEETGLTKAQIRNCVSNMRQRGVDIQVVITARIWIYRGLKEDSKGSFRAAAVIDREVTAEMEKTPPIPKPGPPPGKPITPAFQPPVATPPMKPRGQLVMPSPNHQVEMFRVVHKSDTRVILESADGRLWRAVEQE